MSIANLLKSALIISLGGLFGYNLMKYTHENGPEKIRFMASVPLAKIGQEQVSRSLFDVQLDQSQISKSDSDVSTLTVKVQAFKNLQSGLTYNWNLPSGVNVLNGQVQDQLGSMSIGEVKEITIQVIGFSKELKKYISFEIKGNQNQLPVRREVLISSRIEDSLEYLVQQSEIKKQNGGANKLDARKNKFSPENVIK